jgi:hypothetical protein
VVVDKVWNIKIREFMKAEDEPYIIRSEPRVSVHTHALRGARDVCVT